MVRHAGALSPTTCIIHTTGNHVTETTHSVYVWTHGGRKVQPQLMTDLHVRDSWGSHEVSRDDCKGGMYWNSDDSTCTELII